MTCTYHEDNKQNKENNQQRSKLNDKNNEENQNKMKESPKNKEKVEYSKNEFESSQIYFLVCLLQSCFIRNFFKNVFA